MCVFLCVCVCLSVYLSIIIFYKAFESSRLLALACNGWIFIRNPHRRIFFKKKSVMKWLWSKILKNGSLITTCVCVCRLNLRCDRRDTNRIPRKHTHTQRDTHTHRLNLRSAGGDTNRIPHALRSPEAMQRNCQIFSTLPSEKSVLCPRAGTHWARRGRDLVPEKHSPADQDGRYRFFFTEGMLYQRKIAPLTLNSILGLFWLP